MPRNARSLVPGVPYHVTQRGTDRQKVFFSIQDRKVYLDLLHQNLADAGVRLLAYCLMTNHIHAVVTPERGDSLAVLFRRVHGRYAQYLNARMGRSGHLWQARFYSCPLAEGHLDTPLRYVECNPVRARLVDEPWAYRWSSAAAHTAGLRDGGWLDPEIWRERGGAAGWRELLAGSELAPVIHMLRRCTYAGRPFGGEEFVAAMESALNRRWQRWPFEQTLVDAELVVRWEAARGTEL